MSTTELGGLTDIQQMMVETVRDFANKELLPQAIEIDRERRFPIESFKKMAELGLLGLPIPEEFEGAGVDTQTAVLVIEELAKVCGSTALGVAAHTSLCTWPIYAFGTDEQRAKYVPDLASGRKLGAFGLTEANAGSDSGGTQTRAVQDGDHWVLNGSKIFITNANYAGTFIATAVTDKSKGTRGGITSFIVERDTPGFEIHKGDEKLGMRGSDWGELTFVDCRIPANQVLGEVGAGFPNFMKTLDGGRVGIAALSLGLAEGAYERSLAYAKEREAFGKPIAKKQAVAFKLADMAVQIEAARALIRNAAQLKDAQQPYTTQAAMAKLFASEMAMRVTFDAIQVHGGYGFTNEYHVERMWRDAKLCTIGEGTSEIQRIVISREILSNHE
ncbi:MAG: putative acyl-CoA dehydrogenase YngJ [Planctomycetota bacterium]|nr:MAG: putative acyl-CoA dehydrogenase YngJ [Planctomycetota bacterium]